MKYLVILLTIVVMASATTVSQSFGAKVGQFEGGAIDLAANPSGLKPLKMGFGYGLRFHPDDNLNSYWGFKLDGDAVMDPERAEIGGASGRLLFDTRISSRPEGQLLNHSFGLTVGPQIWFYFANQNLWTSQDWLAEVSYTTYLQKLFFTHHLRIDLGEEQIRNRSNQGSNQQILISGYHTLGALAFHPDDDPSGPDLIVCPKFEWTLFPSHDCWLGISLELREPFDRFEQTGAKASSYFTLSATYPIVTQIQNWGKYVPRFELELQNCF